MTYHQGKAYFKGKPRTYIIDCFLPDSSVVMITAREGKGKTKLALAMAKAVASGGFFLGQYVQKGKVAWYNLDQVFPIDLKDRAEELDPSLNFVDDVLWYDGELNLIETVKHPKNPKKDITNWELLIEVLQDYKLIVFDTWSELLIGSSLDENSPTETAMLMKKVVQIARGTGAAILVLHHTAKDPRIRGGRGSTGSAAKVDVTMELEGYKDKKGKWHEGSMDTAITIKMGKSRHHRIHIFPVEINANGYVLTKTVAPGIPKGAWLGLISQTQTNLTQFQQDCQWFIYVALQLGMRLKHNEMTIDRRTLSSILHYSSNHAETIARMDAVIAHFVNDTKLRIEQHGNNPYYHIEIDPDEIDQAMRRKRRRQQKTAAIGGNGKP